MKLKVKKLSPDAKLPEQAHPGDAGMDLFALEEVVIPHGKWCLVKTGIAIELPPQTEGQVRPRSGLALKHGITVLNSPGTIDEGYRGEVGVILVNHNTCRFTVEKGMKIAQLVVAKTESQLEVLEVEELSDTSRSEGGFGSTGK